MNLHQFEVMVDPAGNMLVADGWVIQARQGVTIFVSGAGDHPNETARCRSEGNLRAALTAQGRTFLGGSGSGVVISSPPGGPTLFDGLYLPLSADHYLNTSGPGELFLSGGNATLSDGTAPVTGPSSGWPTGGFLVATTYGQDTYNGGDGFTLGITSEPAGNGYPALTIAIPSGLSVAITITHRVYMGTPIPIGGWTDITETITPGEALLWTAAGVAPGLWSGADISIVIHPDGTADFLVSATVMATRANGSPTDPSGIYTATTAGKNAWNAGNAWQAWVTGGRVAPRAGWAYLKIEDVAGLLTSVSGPFFATSLPTPSGNFYYYPLAKCSGTAPPEQLHLGPVQWGHTTGTNGTAGTDGTGLPWIALTEAAYDALTTPDPDTLYDIIP